MTLHVLQLNFFLDPRRTPRNHPARLAFAERRRDRGRQRRRAHHRRTGCATDDIDHASGRRFSFRRGTRRPVHAQRGVQHLLRGACARRGPCARPGFPRATCSSCAHSRRTSAPAPGPRRSRTAFLAAPAWRRALAECAAVSFCARRAGACVPRRGLLARTLRSSRFPNPPACSRRAIARRARGQRARR